jgi:hypothetical protein
MCIIPSYLFASYYLKADIVPFQNQLWNVRLICMMDHDIETLINLTLLQHFLLSRIIILFSMFFSKIASSIFSYIH